jgi:hypothetical protein
MRVDRVTGDVPLAFDNMYDRPIKGSNDWQDDQVVLDVPGDAKSVFFGVLLAGTGEVWISDVRLEVVSANVPVTGNPVDPKQWKQRHPDSLNLDFRIG